MGSESHVNVERAAFGQWVILDLEGGQFCPQPAFSVDGRGRHQGQKPKVLGGGIYPARGFSPA
ncbi:MAG: hypothetical protein ABSF64_33475, partial [Bryobacteraceae bacterium]